MRPTIRKFAFLEKVGERLPGEFIHDEFATRLQRDCISENFGHWTRRNDSIISRAYMAVPSLNI